MTGYPRPGAGTPPATDLSWRSGAACRGMEKLFFGPDDEPKGDRARRAARAAAVCSGCPVRVPCGEFAAAFSIRFGVWAGEDLERARLTAPEGATVLCSAELHWMTPENSKPIAGRNQVRCRACLRIADRRTAAARRARFRQRAAGRQEMAS